MTAVGPLFDGSQRLSPLLSPMSSLNDSKSCFQLDGLQQADVERYYLQLDERTDDGEDENGESVNSQNIKDVRINKDLLVYKAFYFLFYGAVGSLFPYLAVFYKQLYLSAQQVGFLIGIRPFIQMCAGPLWGALADTYNVKRFILLLSIAAWLGTNYSISIVRIPPEVACNNNFTIAKLPEIGKVTEPKKKPPILEIMKIPVNTTNTLFIANSSRKSLIEASKKPIEEIMIRKRDFSLDDDTSTVDEEVLLLMISRSKYHKRKNRTSGPIKLKTKRKKRRVTEEIMTLYLERPTRDIDDNNNNDKNKVTSTKPELWGRSNVSQQDQLLPLQRLLAADELEEEFDSLNTDDEYPWPLDNIESSEQTEVREVSKNALKIFIVLIIITVIGTLLASPAATLADTATLENLGDKTYRYGYQRLWGSFGWGLCAFIVGLIVSGIQNANCTHGGHVDYILSFYVYAVMMAMAFLCAVFFKFNPVENPATYTDSLWEAVKMFTDCQHACFIITLLSAGAAMGFIHTFLFWHLHDLGGTQFLFSIVAAIQCVSEVVMYLVSSYLILKIGCDKVLYIGLFSNVIRLFTYALLKEPLYSIPLEILHGVSSATIWTAAICYIGLFPGTPVTLQAMLHGMYWGLGHGGGGILGGVLVTYIGSNGTFMAYGFICLLNFSTLLIMKYWGKIITLFGDYQFVENIPAGTYILTTMSDQGREQNEEAQKTVR